jgi:hypothetical protein
MSLFGSAAGAIAGGVLNAFGQGMANNANAALAIADRDFQREVLQHRHQWETQDWQKAGFNRIMALNSSGGTGSPTSIAMQNPLSGLGEGVSSAVDKVQAEKSIKSLIKQREYQNKNIEADTHYKYAGAFLADEQTEKYEQEIEQLKQAMPWIVQDFKNKAANSSKEQEVMDSTIAANKAAAAQSYSAGAMYDEQKRKYKLDNDIVENIGTTGRVVRDVVGSVFGDSGRKGFDYFNRLLGGDYGSYDSGWNQVGAKVGEIADKYGSNSSQFDW